MTEETPMFMIGLVMVIAIACLLGVVIWQSSVIHSLEFEISLKDQSLDFCWDHLNSERVHRVLACEFREPIDKSQNINWTKVCGAP